MYGFSKALPNIDPSNTQDSIEQLSNVRLTNTLPSASTSLRNSLLALQQRDLALRAELQTDGTLFEGYHPRMEAVHRDNAKQLRELIEGFGWPNERLAGHDGAEAAWLIAQHSISEPEFMRRCRNLLEKEATSDSVPFWQYAYLDDRIRVSEGKPQRFGTQFELTPDGPVLCEIEDPQFLDQRRQEAGLELIAERLKSMQNEPRPTPTEFQSRKESEMKWRLKVGWSTPSDA